MVVPQTQRLIPKGRGSEATIRRIAMSVLYTPVATNIVVVSDGLRSTLTRSKFSKISWGGMPPDPSTRLCTLYIHSLVLRLLSDVPRATNARRPGNEASARTGNCVLRAPHQSPLYMYTPPPLLQSLDPPLHAYITL